MPEAPRVVWDTDFIDTPGRSYAVSPDGQTLYVVKRLRPQTTDRLLLIQNLGAKVRGLVGR